MGWNIAKNLKTCLSVIIAFLLSKTCHLSQRYYLWLFSFKIWNWIIIRSKISPITCSILPNYWFILICRIIGLKKLPFCRIWVLWKVSTFRITISGIYKPLPWPIWNLWTYRITKLSLCLLLELSSLNLSPWISPITWFAVRYKSCRAWLMPNILASSIVEKTLCSALPLSLVFRKSTTLTLRMENRWQKMGLNTMKK